MSLLGPDGTVLLSLVATTALIVGLAPTALTAGHWQIHRPRTALSLWCAAICGGALTGLAALGHALVVAFGGATSPGPAHSLAVTVAGCLALGVLVVLLAGLGAGSESVVDAEEHNRDLILQLAHDTYHLDERCDLVVLDHDLPLACAVPGERPVVAVSDSLLRRLPMSQVRAVIAHERAHLSARHHLLTRLAGIHTLCLPRFWATRRLRRAVHSLIELAADDRAARVAGPAALANALVTLGAHLQDPGLELRAERLARRRHRRVRHGAPFPTWEVRFATAHAGPSAALHRISG